MSEQVVEPVADAPVAEPVAGAPQEAEVVAAPVHDDEPPTDDAALNQQIADQAISVPDGEKLVPESLLRNVAINYRNKLKDAKANSPEALALKQQLDAVQAQLNEAAPLAQAFRAIQQAQPQQQVQQQQQPAEDTSELVEIAKDFDFYRPDGQPDLDRARRVQARTTRQAETIARQQNAPLIQHTLTGQAQQNVARAKATLHPVTKHGADPGILESLISHVARQEGGLATLANPETVKQIWLNAYALTTLRGEAAPAAVVKQEAVTPPVVTERAGGAVAGQQTALSPAEKRAAKDAGMTEKAYLEVAKGMKW